MNLRHFSTMLVRCLTVTFFVFVFLIIFWVRPVSADSTAFVRVIHASPDIGTADVFVDGSKLLSSFQFGAVTDYVQVPTGPHKVQIALIGKGIGAAVITQTLMVSPNIAYTVAAIGIKATGFSLQVFVDDNQLAPGKTKVRVYQLSPDAGMLNVSSSAKTSIKDLPYPQASNYLSISAGTYTFNVVAQRGTQTLQISAILKENTITSIFAVGEYHGSPGIELVTAQANGQPNWPGTGSDPYPQPVIPALNPWLVGMFLLVVLSASGAIWSLVATRPKRLRSAR